METVYRDYRDKNVQFFYVYKAVEHPEVNNFVSAFNIEERLKHIAIAKKRFQSEIPWICDTMDHDVENAFGGAPNGEYILDPQGKIVRKRFWSNPKTLRMDLEKLIGKVDKVTTVADLPTAFTPEPRTIASGIVPRIDLPAGLKPFDLVPQENGDHPHFAKLRVEGSSGLFASGQGEMYLGVYLDPIYGVHWNNRAGRVKIQIDSEGKLELENSELVSDEVKADADVDPRQFLVKTKMIDKGSPVSITLTYTVCDDAETFCTEVSQSYTLNLKPNRNLGTRPGIFLNEMFANVRDFDKNKDGDITTDELPPGKVTLYVGHMDYDGNETIESNEIDAFLKMFNNGKGISEFNDGGGK
ncbi:MAG: hypothetical protein ACI814_001644 [Mariniblastus sp.]